MLYIHIPYCRKKCLYCDFFSGGAQIADWESLTQSIINELRERIEELPHKLDSIYIGGGTPSLIPPDLFYTFSNEILRIINESGKQIDPQLEFTVEVNPEDVDTEHISDWKRGGINRISVGIQSFSDELLSVIGRNHKGACARKALQMLSENFENISGDLIFGLPGQTERQLEDDIDELLSYNPKHISIYSLMYEEGTALSALRNAGRIKETDESIVNRQYQLIQTKLRDAGFRHYEISNYAVPGFESRHNSGYWSGKPYLGLGPAAHSFDGLRTRRSNAWDIKGYLNRFAADYNIESPKEKFFDEEILTEEEKKEEFIMLSLRTDRGINLDEFKKKFGEKEYNRLLKKAERHKNANQLRVNDNQLTLTEKGIMISDSIIIALL